MNAKIAQLFRDNEYEELLALCQDKGKLIYAEKREKVKYMSFKLGDDTVKFRWNNQQVLEFIEVC